MRVMREKAERMANWLRRASPMQVERVCSYPSRFCITTNERKANNRLPAKLIMILLYIVLRSAGKAP